MASPIARFGIEYDCSNIVPRDQTFAVKRTKFSNPIVLPYGL